MIKRLLDYDPDSKTSEYIHLDGTGNAVIESIQDVEPSIQFNQFMAEKLDRKGNRWFVSNIPNHLCVKWAQESGTKIFTRDWVEYAKKKVMSADFSKLNPNRIRI